MSVRAPVLAVLLLASLAASAADAPPIVVEVDLRDVSRYQTHTRVLLPVKGGEEVALAYPKWIPGEHGPTGPVTDVAGLELRAAGAGLLSWRRDETDPWTILVKVPPGVRTVEARFDYLAPPEGGGFTAGADASSKLALLSWNHVVLYPKGSVVRDLAVKASVHLPDGWKFSTALPVEGQAGPRAAFAPVSLEMLLDSPLLAGAHHREVFLGNADDRAHFLVLAADSPEALELPAETKAAYERLVLEGGALFGARHYDSYRFLVSLSDHVAHFGLEHHQSSDNRMVEKALTDADVRTAWATLLPHEYVHSWNGKYRRPAGMVTRDFHDPVRTNLLWVYEGLTNYLGIVLAARSGLLTQDQFREWVAMVSDQVATQKGRSWRPLADTAVDANHLFESRDDGGAWRRDTDFYTEGALLWLEVDVMIRQMSDGKRSLDDFCRRFHGGASSGPAVKSYSLADIAKELDAVAPHDWAGFFDERVQRTSDRAPLGGLERAGWKLAGAPKPSSVVKATEARRKKVMLGNSLGFVLRKEGGQLVDVVPGTPADAAKLSAGAKIVAVNGRRYTADVFLAAVAATKDGAKPLELLVESDDFFRTVPLDWRGGLRYPVLERIEGKPDLLSQISAPLIPAK